MAVAAIVTVSSCSTKKNIVGTVPDKGTGTVVSTKNDDSRRALSFVQKVYDNSAYVKQVSSKIDFTVKSGSRDISVDGTIHMRKDDVIRIQLTPLGIMEVGRLEFTPDYVLVMDRINKEYVKAKYSEIDFLANNGITFSTLQSLFWNQLFLPGVEKLGEGNLSTFGVGFNASEQQNKVMTDKGKMHLEWLANVATGLIDKALVTYDGGKNGTSQLQCDYSNFTNLGSKKFPLQQVLSFKTSAMSGKEVSLVIKRQRLATDTNFESRTTVSDKFRQVSASDVLGRLMSL